LSYVCPLMDTARFTGTHTALVTPFKGDAIAWDDLEKVIEMQIAGGVDGLVAVGTTGESPTLDHKEHAEVIRFIIEKVAGRLPVMAGTGANATNEAVQLTQSAHEAGADAFLQVCPYYNKPSQEGLFRHFCAVAEATDKPIVLYSIPGRCGIEIGVETVRRLHQAHPHIIGIKEAGGKCDRVSELRAALGEDFLILCGDDALALPFITLGAKGVISVASNLLPAEVSQMIRAALNNDFAKAIAINHRLNGLFSQMLSLGPNPVPVKQAMALAGQISSAEVRLPLCPLGEADVEALRQLLARTGVL